MPRPAIRTRDGTPGRGGAFTANNVNAQSERAARRLCTCLRVRIAPRGGMESREVRHAYHIAGIEVAAPFAIPEWLGFATASTGPMVRIEFGKGRAPGGLPGYGEPVGDHAAIAFDHDSLGTWRVIEGKRIELWPHKGADKQLLRAVTIGSAWAALAYQRRWLMAHASAVVMPGTTDAILICGPSGSGKSTLAALLSANGARPVSDDLCRIDMETGGAPIVYPSASDAKLSHEAVTYLGWSERIERRVEPMEGKLRVPFPMPPTTRPVPIRALVLLSWANEVKMNRIAGGEAVAEVAAALCYRPKMLHVMQMTEQHVAHCAALCSQVPVYRLTRPRSLPDAREHAELIEAIV